MNRGRQQLGRRVNIPTSLDTPGAVRPFQLGQIVNNRGISLQFDPDAGDDGARTWRDP